MHIPKKTFNVLTKKKNWQPMTKEETIFQINPKGGFNAPYTLKVHKHP